MVTKKSIPKKTVGKKSILTKIAEKAGFFAGEVVGGKEQLMEMAGEAIESVKSTLHGIIAKDTTKPKNRVKDKPRQSVTKSVHSSVKKVTNKVAAKKASPLKKVIKKNPKKPADKK